MVCPEKKETDGYGGGRRINMKINQMEEEVSEQRLNEFERTLA